MLFKKKIAFFFFNEMMTAANGSFSPPPPFFSLLPSFVFNVLTWQNKSQQLYGNLSLLFTFSIFFETSLLKKAKVRTLKNLEMPRMAFSDGQETEGLVHGS